MELKTEIERLSNVAKDPLDQVQMWLMWRMHVEAGLLDGMADVRARQGKILQSPGKTSILRRISKKGASIREKLQRVSIGVAQGLQSSIPARWREIDGVLTLREKHAGGGPHDRNPEEVGEVPEIRHRELAMKEPGDVLEQLWCRCSEDDVV